MWRPLALAWLLGCGSGAATTSTAMPPAPGPRGAESPAGSPAGTARPARADAAPSRGGGSCDPLPVGELSIDGLLDDWRDARVVARIGSPADGAVELHCAWDGQSLALALAIADDRVVRVKGGAEDRVTVSLAAGGKPLAIEVLPGNAIARPKIVKPSGVEVADSLQPNGFSVELALPATAIPQYSPSTPSFGLELVFHDSDAATGGDTVPLRIAQALELAERKDLLDDFLAAVRLRRAEITLDTLAELDPDRAGKERLVAGGTAIGVLTDQFAFVTLPAASAADVKSVELMPLGPRGQQVVSAVVRQTGNGGSRDLLMLWTVWTGQLQPLVVIEVRKQLGASVLESTWKLVKGKKAMELVVEPKPAVGFSAETWNELPAGDSDSILLPWDEGRAGIAYTLVGAEIARRDLPRKKRR